MPFKSEDVAYAAGLFEGEGSVTVARSFYTRRGEKRTRKTPQVKLRVAMTDKEPVERFATIFGGRVNGPYKYQKSHYKQYWVADIDSPPKVKLAIEAMLPFLSPRRRGQLEVLYSL